MEGRCVLFRYRNVLSGEGVFYLFMTRRFYREFTLAVKAESDGFGERHTAIKFRDDHASAACLQGREGLHKSDAGAAAVRVGRDALASELVEYRYLKRSAVVQHGYRVRRAVAGEVEKYASVLVVPVASRDYRVLYVV